MAHHKSALKRMRQSRKLRLYNRQFKKATKLAIRAVREATDFDVAVVKLSEATKILDRVAAKGILHKNNAANKKSKLAKFVSKLKPAAV